MNDRIRRILIFIFIVGAGTLLIFFDLPLLFILPLIVIIGLILLILLGAIPVAELKGILASPFRKKGSEKPAAVVSAKPQQKPSLAPATPKRKYFGVLSSLFKRKPKDEPVSSGATAKKPGAVTEQKKSGFDIRSWFRKKPSGTPMVAAAQKQPAAAPAKKGGISHHFGSLVSSLKTFGTILKTKKDTDPDKIRKIDGMLDQAVHDKPDKVEIPVMKSSPEKPIPGGSTGAIGGAGSGSLGVPDTADEDPFSALSEDEFDTSLLDGLDEDDGLAKAAATPTPAGPSPVITFTLQEEGAEPAMQEFDMPGPAKSGEEAPLSPELAAAAEDILKANEPESGEVPALEGLESVDDNLGDLDNLNLDSMDLGEDEDEEEEIKDFGQPAPAPSVPMPEPAPAAPALAASAGGPKGSDQSEMAAFAAASGGDDDLISSLTSEIKTVKKDKDISLLRDLKDFRAPGTTIEAELTELYATLNSAAEKQKKIRGRSGATKPQAK